MFKTRINDHTQEPEAYGPAILKTISMDTRMITNTKDGKDKGYHVATAEVTYVGGAKAIVGASIWAKSLVSNPAFFTIGNTIELVVQVEGEYKGWAKIGMPALEKVDVSKLGLPIAAAQPAIVPADAAALALAAQQAAAAALAVAP
tara:strand:- start:143 stop:580 length:438 start_codon:yes stop_codon:yes gene_type:complete